MRIFIGLSNFIKISAFFDKALFPEKLYVVL